MKNMRIYKRTIAVALSASITLLTGCTSVESKEEVGQQSQEAIQSIEESQLGNLYLSEESVQGELEKTEKEHTHVIVYFGDQAVILRECEGYEINANLLGYSLLRYGISIGYTHFTGYTDKYNVYDTNHDDFIEEVENMAIEKGAKVLKIQPQNSK